ncbi:unnamed protein product [Cuscuta epithymum]|uniref:Uncharacterized protein n=1 Tax=Cuscuta epithymum TaxID=186058 RepID=A0AAV0CVM3_9ASTE|nr:unnamed protein product [Cuscuta epithymum]
MAIVSKTRTMLEDLVKEGSFKWLNRTRSSFDKDLEEMEKSQSSGGMNWLPELSRYANVVTWKCSKILDISMSQLQENFEQVASDSLKHPPHYARNFLEYCCFKALALSVNVNGYLGDRSFRCLTFDMMVAWEFPAASSQASASMEEATVGVEAFSRISSAVPIIANVIVSDSIFAVLTSSTDYRLHFSVYDKYLIGMERVIKKLKSQSESSHLSPLRSDRGEKILELDGTVTTQPVLEHVGISTWPGRLTLTDHALYFEALRVVSYDKAKVYDLSQDLNQIVKPELTGPWGTRLFDKAVFYKSTSLQDPVVMEFPELKGHTRRDYWLAIIREILYVHRFIKKFQITGIEREEALLKAIFGILRVQALKETSSTSIDALSYEDLLMFNVCDQLPGGDVILETLANRSNARELERTSSPKCRRVVHSISPLTMASNLGFVFGSVSSNEMGISVGEIVVGEVTPLERAVKESRTNHKKLVSAQASVDGVKVDGIDTNLAVMKELLLPIIQLGNWLLSLAHWEDPLRSMIFCLAASYAINRGWLGYASAALLAFFAVFMLLTRYTSRGRPADELKVLAPPEMNTVEQLLAVQNAISQAEELIQDGNIVLLKFRALLLSIFPQATEKFAGGLLVTALVLAILPYRYITLVLFLEYFTRYSPLRKSSTERWNRRLREWWFSIPAAPVTLERSKEDKKRR